MKSIVLTSLLLVTALAAYALPSQLGERRIGGRTVLTDANGMTVYTFDQDRPGTSTCTGRCLGIWPPLHVQDATQLTGEFGVIVGNDGKAQVTVNGMPLYYFSQDVQPGDLRGEYPGWRPVVR